jgi:hypothetical protein
MIGVRQAPWPAGLAARLARLIREASRLVNVTALAQVELGSVPGQACSGNFRPNRGRIAIKERL